MKWKKLCSASLNSIVFFVDLGQYEINPSTNKFWHADLFQRGRPLKPLVKPCLHQQIYWCMKYSVSHGLILLFDCRYFFCQLFHDGNPDIIGDADLPMICYGLDLLEYLVWQHDRYWSGKQLFLHKRFLLHENYFNNYLYICLFKGCGDEGKKDFWYYCETAAGN